jgi:predicted ATP-grasp superfamily ATP-dependent carboligase
MTRATSIDVVILWLAASRRLAPGGFYWQGLSIKVASGDGARATPSLRDPGCSEYLPPWRESVLSGRLSAMRVLLYEWCSSGGLVDDAPAIAREGRMMLEAVAADAAREPGLDVAVLVDATRPIDLPPRVRRLTVAPGDDRAALAAAAAHADWTVIVAPESDGILLERVRTVRSNGGRALAPADRVIATAADKQATIDALAARGLPVPAGRSLAAGEAIPAGFPLPAVRKARGGCGGEALEVIHRPDAPSAAVATRLEPLVAGAPIGVSLVCGAGHALALPPMQQRFTAGASPRYLGSDLVADERAARRATALALRASAALAAEAGWLGVDLILGRRPDGRDDRVLEVNPRLTTSFVGLAPLFASSLVAAMIEAATGNRPALVRTAGPSGTGSFDLAAD